ncbi:MAG: AbrB/MazE/SpoVT family DNA-binding domain-containing protein [Candidatus Kerfeldbacteria bacterium]|nr:AbrB/MazE/SpoVT family DNA-binding domain-containing protein [Candidatus Kerfeldbacteria bacterium]
MIFQTTLTQKGQITIPKGIRDILKLSPFAKVRIRLANDQKTALIEPAEDFINLAQQVTVKKKHNPIKARELLERRYERI